MACARSTLLTEDEALRVLRILGSLHCYAHARMVLDSSHATHAHQSMLTEDKALRVLRILGTGIALLCACSQNTGLDSALVPVRYAVRAWRRGAKRKSQSSTYVRLSPVLALSLLCISQEINPSTLSPPCNFSYERELHSQLCPAYYCVYGRVE